MRRVVWLMLIPILALGAPALAERPAWTNFPDECLAPTGVCFFEMDYPTIWYLETEGVPGDPTYMRLYVASMQPLNNFLRENPDGTLFLHVNDQVCDMALALPPFPYGEWWWVDPPFAGQAHINGTVFRRAVGTGLESGCPFSGMMHGTVVNDLGERFRVRMTEIWKPDKLGCAPVKQEFTLTPELPAP